LVALVLLGLAGWWARACLPSPVPTKPALINEVDQLIDQLARDAAAK
jgi:hypothetical protein